MTHPLELIRFSLVELPQVAAAGAALGNNEAWFGMSVVDVLASWQTVGAVGGFVGLVGLVEAALYFSRKTKTYRLTGANGAKMEVTLAKGLPAAERDRLLHLAAHLPAATGTRHSLPPGILVLTRR